VQANISPISWPEKSYLNFDKLNLGKSGKSAKSQIIIARSRARAGGFKLCHIVIFCSGLLGARILGFFLATSLCLNALAWRRAEIKARQCSHNAGFTLTFWLVASSPQAKMCPERLANPPMQPQWAAGVAIFGAQGRAREHGVFAAQRVKPVLCRAVKRTLTTVAMAHSLNPHQRKRPVRGLHKAQRANPP